MKRACIIEGSKSPSRQAAKTTRALLALIKQVALVAGLAAALTISVVSSGLGKSAPVQLHGEVKAKNATHIQVLVEGKMYAVSSKVDIKDEEGYAKQVQEVPLGVQVLLHVKEGKIVGMTMLAD